MNAVLLEVIRDKMGDGKLLEIENQALSADSKPMLKVFRIELKVLNLA